MLVPRQKSNGLMIEGMRIQRTAIAELHRYLTEATNRGDRYVVYDKRWDASLENIKTARQQKRDLRSVRIVASSEQSVSIRKVLRILERHQEQEQKRPGQIWGIPGHYF